MNYMMALTLFAGACSGPSSPPEEQEKIIENAGDVDAQALELAILMNNAEVLRERLRANWRNTAPLLMSKNPSIVKIDQQSPGFIAEVVNVAEPIVINRSIERAPSYYASAAKIYLKSLTRDDIASLIKFWSSPEGTSIRRRWATAEGAPIVPVDRGVGSEAGSQATASDVERSVSERSQGIKNEMTSAERDAVVRYSASPTAKKIGALNKPLAQAAADWLNEPDPKLEEALGEVIQSVIRRRQSAGAGP